MMKILIINCSPVRNGATAEISRLVGEYTKAGNDVREVCIDDYDIKLCKGCRKCHTTAECFCKFRMNGTPVTLQRCEGFASSVCQAFTPAC